MADNVTITAGTGTTIATDEAGGAQYQRVKLTDGTADSTAVIAGDATNGLDVDVTRVPTDPFGANADASSTNGSISAKLRHLAGVGMAGMTTLPAASVTLPVSDTQAYADDAAFSFATQKVWATGFVADDVAPDLADEGDLGVARMTTDRRVLVQLGESGPNMVRGGGSQTSTTAVTLMSSGGAGTYNYLGWVTVYNTSSSNTGVEIRDGATVAAVLPLPAFGGAIFQPTYPVRASERTAWVASALAATTTVYFYGGGYRAST